MPLRPMAPALGDATFVKVMRRSVVADAAARRLSQPEGAAQSCWRRPPSRRVVLPYSSPSVTVAAAVAPVAEKKGGRREYARSMATCPVA